MTNDIFLFPTLVQATKYEGEFSQELIDFINDKDIYEQPSAGGVYQSIKRNILDMKMFAELKSFLEKTSNDYLKRMNIQNCEAYITISWLNMHEEDTSHIAHIHPNSILSGCFYFTDGTPISFINKESFVRNPNIWFDIADFNDVNYTQTSVPIHKDHALIFPSTLGHFVGFNETKQKRISLAFNTFVRGKLGDTTGYTDLYLN